MEVHMFWLEQHRREAVCVYVCVLKSEIIVTLK